MANHKYLVLLAGGQQSRMQGIADNTPKSLLPLRDGMTGLSHALEVFKNIDFTKRLLIVAPGKFADFKLALTLSGQNDVVIIERPAKCIGVLSVQAALAFAINTEHGDEDALIVFSPTDHWIGDHDARGKVVTNALAILSKHNTDNKVIYIGTPHSDRWSMHFGYLELADPVSSSTVVAPLKGMFEKRPQHERDQLQMRTDVLVNTGLLIGSARTCRLAATQRFPTIAVTHESIARIGCSQEFERSWSACVAPVVDSEPWLSERFDSEAVTQLGHVCKPYVLPSIHEWADVGTKSQYGAEVGLHSGINVEVKFQQLEKCNSASAVVFKRIDVSEGPRNIVPADVSYATLLERRTMLASAIVETPEHLLSAMIAYGASDVEIQLSGPELPIRDAASADWCDDIEKIWKPRRGAYDYEVASLDHPLWLYKRPPEGAEFTDGTFVIYLPPECIPISSDKSVGCLRLTSIVPLDQVSSKPIYWHTFDFHFNEESYRRYRREIAPIPTYIPHKPNQQPSGTYRSNLELVHLFKSIPPGRNKYDVWEMPELYTTAARKAYMPQGQGPAMHKNLDLLGDLSLLMYAERRKLVGWIIASRHGHQDTHALVARLRQSLKGRESSSVNCEADFSALLKSLDVCKSREAEQVESRGLKGSTPTDYDSIFTALCGHMARSWSI